MHTTPAFSLTLAALLAGGAALAQPATGYTGPSSVPVMTVRQLLDTGRDDQHAVLRGRIVSHDGGEHYSFADDTGTMRVEIEARHFPAGQAIGDQQRVELLGEFEKGWRKTEFEVERLTPLP